MRWSLEPRRRLMGIAEELAGIVMREIIDDKGLFSRSRIRAW